MRGAAIFLAVLGASLSRGAEAVEQPQFSATDLEFFERQVRPLLVEHCYQCHSAQGDSIEGGLRLDGRGTILAGGDTQPAVVPGHPEESLLIDAIQYGDLYEMPPKNKLPAESIAVFREWVRRGAPWPEEALAEGANALEAFDLSKRKTEHWAWTPLSDPPLPEVESSDWVKQPLDRFVLAGLESQGIAPAKPASPHTLLRRAYYDLIGLPPSPEAVLAFQADPSAEAYAAVVERLLASPQFGERWGRHWLDVMRYADTRGHEFDNEIPNAWQYRDYVIRALNADLPYDQFVTEHIAGDLLERPRMDPAGEFNESILATGFWYLGEWIHSPVDIRQDETNRFDNAIDVFGKTFLGLTVACARCHDHKFDAISQKDYYALAGFLQSSSYRQVRFESLDANREIVQQWDVLQRDIGAKLAKQAAEGRLAAGRDTEALLLAATEALAAGVTQNAVETPAVQQVAFKPRDVGDGNSGEVLLAAIAQRRGVSVERLAPWLEELLCAAQDAQHPLHGLASAATSESEPQATVASDASNADWALPESTRLVMDFDDPQTEWLTDGPAYGASALRRGQVLPTGEDKAQPVEIVTRGHARLRPELADLQLREGTASDSSVRLSDPDKTKQEDWIKRPGRVLRTPTFELRGGKLFYLLRGAAQVQVVVDSYRLLLGPLHNETVMTTDDSQQWRWVEHDQTPYVGHRVHVEFSPNGDHLLEVCMVAEGETAPTLPPGDAERSSPALPRETIKARESVEELARRYADLIAESLRALSEGKLAESAVHRALACWAVANPQLWVALDDSGARKTLADYQQQSAQLLQRLERTSATAPAIWDGSGENERLLIRGNSRTPGELVERGLLAAIAGDAQAPLQGGSGRLELAQRLFAAENPFPSRVMANRVWHHLFGRGIVPTVDNFGVLGQAPTHPELLDHLASRLIAHRWSLKALIREVMLSQTYQMSSRAERGAQGEELDPQNRLLHRCEVRRLDAEAIRDSMLSVAQRLDLKQFGRSVPVHLTEFMQGRGRPAQSGPLDGDGRRAIYVSVRRNFLSPMMLAFDAPQPVGPRGRRSVSNVPAQALILMNDPFVGQQARRFAEHLIDAQPDEQRRLELMCLEAFARLPDESETTAAGEFLREQAEAYRALDGDANLQLAAWADLCHVMFNLKEFIYLD